jgi:hypothetical protein
LEPKKEEVQAPVPKQTTPVVATPPPRKVLAKPKVVPMKALAAIRAPKYSKPIVTPEKPKETQVQFSHHNNYYGPLFDDDDEDDEPVPAQDPAPPLRVEKQGDSKDGSVPPLRVETIEKEVEPAPTSAPAVPPQTISPEKPKRKRRRWSKRLQQAQRHLINHAQVSDNKIPEDRIAVSAEEIEELANDKEYFAKAYKAIHPDTGQYAEYRHLKNSSEKERWAQAFSKEVGNLYQGSEYFEQGTNTCQFIHKEDVPHEEKVTYCRIVADYRPQKADPYRVRLMAGGPT